MFKKTVAVALTALSLCAGTAFASKSDDRYDRYNPGAAVEESSRSYKEANAYTAVLIGSKDEYLNRQGLFFEIIKDEMNEDRQYGTPEIVCDSDLQAKWIETFVSCFRKKSIEQNVLVSKVSSINNIINQRIVFADRGF